MSKGPALSAIGRADAGSLQIASSAVVIGTAHLGKRALLAEGAVIRSSGAGVEIGTGSAVLESSVVVGLAHMPTMVGRRSTFGHRPGHRGDGRRPLRVGNASIPYARRPRG